MTRFFWILLLLLLLAASIFAPRELQSHLLEIKLFVAQHPVWSPLVFLGLYLIGLMLVFFPVAVLTLLGGFLFGPIWGSVYNILGSLTCALLAFIASRYFLSHFVRERAGVKLRVIMDGVSHEGWRFVAVIRLIPILPFHLLNALLGLTRIGIVQYTFVSLIFMAPVKLTYTYIGSLGEDFVLNPGQLPITKLVVAVSLMTGIACLPFLIKRIRRKV